MTRRFATWALVTTLVACGAHNALAGTLAYWRFEQGPDGTQVPSGTVGFNYDESVPDDSGNGNELDVWDGGGAGFRFRSIVPYATVAQTGAANNFSMKNSGGFPAAFTGPGSIQTDTPAAWTVEASYKGENGGFRTIVGRDGRRGATAVGSNLDQNLAAMYLQAVPGNAVAIKFTDVAGHFHEAISAPNAIQTFNFPTDNDGNLVGWYNLAAVSDGATLSLYIDDVNAGLGYQLVAQTDLTLSGSPNTALRNGVGSDGGDWNPGDWTVGRGMYNGGHGDRAWGFIDEVRISDMALSVDQFLFSEPVPEPGSIALLVGACAAIGAVVARKRIA